MSPDQVSGIAQWEIQAYMYATLTQNSEFQVVCPGGLYDLEAPVQPNEDSLYPYTTFGDWTETHDNLQAGVGRQGTVTMHVWDRYRGSKVVKTIMNTMCRILPDTLQFTTPIWYVNRFYLEFVNNMMVPASQTHHGILRFRFKATQKA